ncbi:MAG: ribulose bisphosphate carboxylase small subunit [Phormidesmis sp.]
MNLSANPQVHTSAEVHEFSLVEGDVQIESGASVAPGTAITAQPGASVSIGEQCHLLPSVVVEAIAGAQVMGNAGSQTRSIYVGDRTVIAHKSLIHSPAFIGEDCFVGFRSTVFNARVGQGCVILMHALVQDVEIPPGRCVPSGAVINSQHQADQLPKVRPEDLAYAKEIIGSSVANTRSFSSNNSSTQNRSKARLVSVHGTNHSSNLASHSSNLASTTRNRSSKASRAGRKPSQSSQFPLDPGAHMQAQRLSSEIVQQVRQHLSAGYRIGMEHADKRRYRSGVWETCTPIKDTREQAVFEALERCLAEHEGEYVRMFGIDPKVKQRVGMVTVQRPGDKPVAQSSGSGGSRSYGTSSSYGNASYSNNGNAQQSGGGLEAGVAQKVRNLLNAGYQIGTEHAGPRHYRSNVWKVCSPIESRNEREVFSKLEHCLQEHSGEYIRMFGINAKSNSRTATTTIQRADGKPVEVSAKAIASSGGGQSSPSSGYGQSSSQGSQVGDEVAQAVSQIIRGGNTVGVEFADKRRFRSGIWQTAPSIKASSESGAIAQLQNFLTQHADKYVRIFGINSQVKTRGAATTVQKPGQSNSSPSKGAGASTNGREAARDPINANPPHYDDPAFLNGASNGGSGMDNAAIEQVTQLVNQGLKISIEFADKRRFRSGIWKTGPSIQARRPADAISELTQQLTRHSNDYVRIVGIDSGAKRRVAEVTIHRPGQSNANSGRQAGSASSGHASTAQSGGYRAARGQNTAGGGNSGMESKVMDQITQLMNQGHKISLEYADKRRYRSGIWKTGNAIAARRPAEAISELGKQLARHQGEYVRLVGTDTQAKRRVLEATIQRP